MKGYMVVNSEVFFKMIISEIISNDNVIDNKYKLERSGSELNFYGNAFTCYIRTNVVDAGQLKSYYDELNNVFSDKINELVVFSDPSAELLLIVNKKVINIDSDNECDKWIIEKMYGRPTTHKK